MTEIKLWTALITPMHEDGSVHFGDLERVARLQESAGNGILLIGSTGEGLALDDSEKKEIVDFVLGLNLKVPVMVGIGGFNLKAQKNWIEYCNKTSVDVFLLVTPLYAKPGPEGQKEWFNTLMDASDKPCMVYNIPGRTGVKLTPQVLKNISEHKQFWAVKEASGSITEYREFLNICPNVPLFSGDDGLLATFSEAGCSGLVSVVSNVWPAAAKRYTEKCLSGDTENLFPVWEEAIKALFSSPNPIPTKVLLKEKKIITSSKLRPPLTEKEVKDISPLMEADRKITNWYNSNR
jgi:4-hydroxy-tetrahydrodipicolinate synthase